MSRQEQWRQISGFKSTILYFHGGGAVLCDPSTHRPLVRDLCRRANTRALSVRYRLAPQNPFPSALVDALLAYLYLLYPPSDAYHEPISPGKIILAGDSSGGAMCLALIQLLLSLARTQTNLRYNGSWRTVPLPAAVATVSPWLDITRSMPSWSTNAAHDYLPNPDSHPDGMTYPVCPSWPAAPTRPNFIAETTMLKHPLVSPLAATSWEGSPPWWVCVGGHELLRDEIRFVAAKMVREGVLVQYSEWRGGLHSFISLALGSRAGQACLDDWVAFLTAVTGMSQNGKEQSKKDNIKPNGMAHEQTSTPSLCTTEMSTTSSFVNARTLARTHIEDLENLAKWTEEHVHGVMASRILYIQQRLKKDNK